MNYFNDTNYKFKKEFSGLQLGFNILKIKKAWFKTLKDNLLFEMYVTRIVDEQELDTQLFLSSLSMYSGNSVSFRSEFEIAKLNNIDTNNIKIVKEPITLFNNTVEVDVITNFTGLIFKTCLGKRHIKKTNKIYTNWEILQVFRTSDNKTCAEIENNEEAKSYTTYENRSKSGLLEKYIGCTKDEVLSYQNNNSSKNAENTKIDDKDMDF